MADGGGWWGSLSGVVNAAKNKSAEVFEFVKRDLDELSSTVKNEASHVVNSTTSVLKEQLSFDQPESTVNTMKRSMSSFLGTVNNVLNPAPDDSDQEAMVMRDNVPVVLTRFQAQLHTLITSEETFLKEPLDLEAAQFTAWLDIQEDLLNKDNLTKLMVAYTELHTQYTKLVPSKVSHADFWQRFLFRRALLEDEEAHRQAQERRQLREAQEAEHFLSNQDDDISSNKVHISDEEQMRLLQEYEKECKIKSSDEDLSRDQTKPSSPVKLPLKENHYSDGKSPQSNDDQPKSEEELKADGRIGAVLKYVRDALTSDDETEESSASSYVKYSNDMLRKRKGEGEDADTGTEDNTAISSSSSSSATLPDDGWVKVVVEN